MWIATNESLGTDTDRHHFRTPRAFHQRSTIVQSTVNVDERLPTNETLVAGTSKAVAARGVHSAPPIHFPTEADLVCGYIARIRYKHSKLYEKLT